MDRLQIKDLEIFAYHGLFPSENLPNGEEKLEWIHKRLKKL